MPEAMVSTFCPICGPGVDSDVVYNANFQPADLNPLVFSQRRLPDRIHFRMVRCRKCRLLRSDPIANAATLSTLYRQSHGTDTEVDNLRKTYGRYLDRAAHIAGRRRSLLEIGSGTGFMLEEALNRGFASVAGIEPSEHAIANAPDRVRGSIRCAMFDSGLFDESSFDVICLFQVFDHMPDPAGVLAECERLLRPGGVVLALNHDLKAAVNSLLGERSPIIDIEHTYLYDPSTMRTILGRAGLQVREIGRAWNRYSIEYLVHLMPLPFRARRQVTQILRRLRVARLPLSIPIGNLYAIASKREES